jgi:3',5'-cyclic AMP phosphodiesterase CpdA
VTGDIAFSGAPDQYFAARAWLLDLAKLWSLDPTHIFTVPGNHDIERATDADRSIKRLVRDLREGHEDLDEALRNSADRVLLTRRLQHYLDFSAILAPACFNDPPGDPSTRLAWMHRLDARGGLRIRLIGLNTALLAADDQDQRRLRLGKEQLARAFTDPPPEDNELLVVLSHHPFQDRWLADQREADSWVRSHGHLHLSGHVHEADTEELRSGGGSSLLRIVAGAVHGDKLPPDIPAGHGYSLASVLLTDEGALRLRVWPRRFSDKNKDFRPDVDNIRDASSGRTYAEHELPRLRLSSPARGALP